MKIAIKGHESRGKEVIRILESLGGNNLYKMTGSILNCAYYINRRHIISGDPLDCVAQVYTLEEFEKEFPFKVGDIVLITGAKSPNEIMALELCMNRLCYKLNNGLHYDSETLTIYKKMKEERNITLTLDKAKEWYNKGGELKEVALQAFTEKELNPLPRSWKDYCKNYPIKPEEIFIDGYSKFIVNNVGDRNPIHDKNICPSRKSAEAHLAMIQLEQLRDCYRQRWVPDWLNGNEAKYAVKGWRDTSSIERRYVTHEFLSFKTYEIACEFQQNFKDLIELAGDLI